LLIVDDKLQKASARTSGFAAENAMRTRLNWVANYLDGTDGKWHDVTRE